MATTIQNFFEKAVQNQFARDFLFRVNEVKIVGMNFKGEDELVYARTAALPGRTIDNKTVNYFGQEFQVPGRATYSNAAGYSIEFYHDENTNLRGMFEAASRAVFDNDTSLGQYGMPGEESLIELAMLNKELKTVRKCKLFGASVRDVGEISHAIADGTGEVLTFPVTFAYHFYRME